MHCTDCVAAAHRNRPPAVRRALRAHDQPWVTYGMIALISVIYLGQLASDEVTATLALVPLLSWHEPWRLVTNALVHDPNFPLHIIGNVLLLVLLGRAVEPALGKLRYAMMCLISALGGTVGVLWTTSPPEGVRFTDTGWISTYLGISTVGYGIMCALLILEIRRRGEVRSIAVLIMINVAFSLTVSNISWQGHLGGGMAGLLATWVFTRPSTSRQPGGSGTTIFRRIISDTTGTVVAQGLSELGWTLVWTILMVGLLGAAVVGRYALVAPLWGGFGV
ncbi:rhomboid family intramembrane serine protease [Austwickia sp. TVS 96-490-7B]|uniref:rhomboid family intramembrane serine protease n=1 Tax=Austwickia sp. TVS 96-490-7B TaxID=2830843 RepID=UPI001C572F30|nr:rhomboid family intramembrane serine protease [Austwickia sp. TVS 96-490-7B]